jgi:DNA repair protein RadD
MLLQPRKYQQDAADAAIAHMRKTAEPGILELATAAGKSIVIAMIAQVVNAAGKRTLVLQPNADLTAQNASKIRATGEKCSVFCAGLNLKHTGHSIVVGTPLSVVNALERFNEPYALVIIDECDGVSEDEESTYQRIISHLRNNNPRIRILGLTATPVRGKHRLVDQGNTFLHSIFRLPHNRLSKLGFVVPYTLGVTHDHYDLAKVKLQSNGKFKQSDVDAETLGKERLTRAIVNDVVQITKDRKCTLFFAASIKHAEEIFSYLPEPKSLITGDTNRGIRRDDIESARNGNVQYLVTVNALSVGTDIPTVDTVAFLRATESVRLLLQAMGRGCRLSDPEWPNHPSLLNWQHDDYRGKLDCLVLDYAENIERHQLDDDLTIAGLTKQKAEHDDDEYFEIACPDCGTNNRHTAQRCVGECDGNRCEYRFIFKECDSCHAKNSPSARYCRLCQHELIDPNDKLTRNAARKPGEPFYATVKSMTLRRHFKNGEPMIRVDYVCEDDLAVSEFLKSETEHPFHLRRFHGWAIATGAVGRLVDDVIAQAERLKTPDRLLLRRPKGSKYYSVEGHR